MNTTTKDFEPLPKPKRTSIKGIGRAAAFSACLLAGIVLFSQNALAQAGKSKERPLDLKGTRVLVCASYFDLQNIPAVKRMEKAGAEVRVEKLENLTWEVVRPFQAMIVVFHGTPARELTKVLTQFVNSGGGLMTFRVRKN